MNWLVFFFDNLKMYHIQALIRVFVVEPLNYPLLQSGVVLMISFYFLYVGVGHALRWHNPKF